MDIQTHKKQVLFIMAVITQIVATYGLITLDMAVLLTTAPVGIILLIVTYNMIQQQSPQSLR